MSLGRAIYERAMPLAEFDEEHRAEIERLAEAPKPPGYWLKADLFEMPSRAWYEWHWRRGMFPSDERTYRGVKQSLRLAVIERDGFVCGLCGGEVEPDDVHIDHIMPKSLGGPDLLDNLQVSHSLCNMRKGNRIGS